MNQPHFLAWIIVIPLAAAAVLFFLRGMPARIAAASTGAAMLICSIIILLQVKQAGVITYALGSWSGPLGIELLADGLSALLLLMTAVTGLCVSIYSAGYFSQKELRDKEQLFWPLWMFLWAALNALFLSADIFNIYVTVELLGLCAVALISISGSKKAIAGAVRYLFVTVLGSLTYLLGVALIYANYSALDIRVLSALTRTDAYTNAAFILITVGLIAKTALFPLHFWLPPAHSSALSPVSAILSGLVVKASFYLLVRLWFSLFGSDYMPAAADFTGWLGCAAIVWGSFHALRQKSLKMLIAYSTVAQIGYMFLLFPLAAQQISYASAATGTIFQIMSHAFAKSAMFLAAGNIILALGHDRMADMAGVSRRMTLTFFTIGIAGVSLMGLPVSGGFSAKWFFLSACLQSGQWWWILFIAAGSLMAAGYIFLIWSRTFQESDEPKQFVKVPLTMELSAMFLSLLSLSLGFGASAIADIISIGSPLGRF